MPERGRPRAFNRDTALRRAMEIFWAKGYEGTSLADLTGAMGIKSPSLYAAFGSKEALFLEATELYTRVEGTGIWTVLETAPTTREAIAGFLGATADAYSQDGKPQGCLIVLGALHQDTSSKVACKPPQALLVPKTLLPFKGDLSAAYCRKASCRRGSIAPRRRTSTRQCSMALSNSGARRRLA